MLMIEVLFVGWLIKENSSEFIINYCLIRLEYIDIFNFGVNEIFISCICVYVF